MQRQRRGDWQGISNWNRIVDAWRRNHVDQVVGRIGFTGLATWQKSNGLARSYQLFPSAWPTVRLGSLMASIASALGAFCVRCAVACCQCRISSNLADQHRHKGPQHADRFHTRLKAGANFTAEDFDSPRLVFHDALDVSLLSQQFWSFGYGWRNRCHGHPSPLRSPLAQLSRWGSNSHPARPVARIFRKAALAFRRGQSSAGAASADRSARRIVSVTRHGHSPPSGVSALEVSNGRACCRPCPHVSPHHRLARSPLQDAIHSAGWDGRSINAAINLRAAVHNSGRQGDVAASAGTLRDARSGSGPYSCP